VAGRGASTQGSVCQQIEDKRGNVQKALREAREDCLRTVNRHFDELEGRIESEIANEGKKNSLHSYYRLETLNTLLSKEVGNLLVYANDLTSPKFLETIPKVEKEVFPNSQEFHLRATKELKENEVYTASVSYRQDLLPELTNHLKRLINLDFLLPRVEYVVELGRGQSREQVRPQSLRKSTSSVVLTSPRVGDANLKTFSVFNPKPTTSVILTSAPVSPVLNSLRNQSMTGSMLRSSRLACDLKSIRETKREISGIDSSSSLTSSLLGKENDLAHSTYYDSSSNFFKQ
jgi:hypothetical protein